MSNEGKKCTVHYTGTFNDGTKFDSSYDRGEPIDFVCGAGMMIKGFDEAVKGMAIGDIIDVHLMPEEAYGMPDPDNILTVEISQLPGAEVKLDSQMYFAEEARKRSAKPEDADAAISHDRVFIPIEAEESEN